MRIVSLLLLSSSVKTIEVDGQRLVWVQCRAHTNHLVLAAIISDMGLCRVHHFDASVLMHCGWGLRARVMHIWGLSGSCVLTMSPFSMHRWRQPRLVRLVVATLCRYLSVTQDGFHSTGHDSIEVLWLGHTTLHRCARPFRVVLWLQDHFLTITHRGCRPLWCVFVLALLLQLSDSHRLILIFGVVKLAFLLHLLFFVCKVLDCVEFSSQLCISHLCECLCALLSSCNIERAISIVNVSTKVLRWLKLHIPFAKGGLACTFVVHFASDRGLKLTLC